MTAPPAPFAAPGQRRIVAVLLALVWLAMVSGFGLDSFNHIARHGLDYPLIVHVHALVFTTWLALFTVQVVLVRQHDLARHRRLGQAGAVLAAAMIVLGVVTALTVASRDYALTGDTPEFLAIEFLDLIVFGGFTAAALLLRRHPAAHKRLMLLALFYLSAPGFARALNGVMLAGMGAVVPIHAQAARQFLHIFTGPDLLIAALGVYDRITSGRLHPAYVIGVVVIAGAEALGIHLLHDPGWLRLTMALIGH